jgi:7,8-dihydroneopterin aldolase/epimerase/oxygenase
MVTVKLDQVRLHAFHGIYAGEPVAGGDFELNLDVEYEDAGLSFDSLDYTISYVALLDLVKARMETPTPLLEKVAKMILDDIIVRFPFVKNARISIYKLQAPIARFQGRVGITLSRVY